MKEGGRYLEPPAHFANGAVPFRHLTLEQLQEERAYWYKLAHMYESTASRRAAREWQKVCEEWIERRGGEMKGWTLSDRALRVALSGVVPEDDPHIIADLVEEINRLQKIVDGRPALSPPHAPLPETDPGQG